MYVILLKYVKPLAEIDKLLSEHADFLERFYRSRNFIVSGRRNPRTGGIILANADNEQMVWDIIRQDPFYRSGAVEYEVIEFIPSKYIPEVSSLVNK
ncbi:YciI family protein [Anaeroselena agilis]|uniref:YciI family protein n=1 Tax=Anaeroselena agilis TaxID=3063788 RepID=A0ABU3NVZ9_9FIRM|nr:YciI family protein [Selenomonadales bacterium 4137-cl]